MKKFTSFLLSILFILTMCLGPVNAWAKEITVRTDAGLTVGETVEIPVYADNGNDLCGFGFEVAYNPEVLQPVSVTAGPVISNGSFNDSIGTEKYSNPFRVVWAGVSALNRGGLLFTVKFSVIGTANTTVSFKSMPKDTYDQSYEKISIPELKVTIGEKCNHQYRETVVTNPTCGKEGLKSFECSLCGNKYTQSIPATGNHTFDNGTVTKAPTPIETGVKTFICQTCGAVRTETLAVTEKYVNPLSVSVKTAKVKYAKLKKKKQTVAVNKVIVVNQAQGILSYAKVSGNKKITVNPTTGKITLKKGLKKGTYKVTVSVNAAETDLFKAGSAVVTVKIKVK